MIRKAAGVSLLRGQKAWKLGLRVDTSSQDREQNSWLRHLVFAFSHLDTPGQAMGLGKTKVRDGPLLSPLPGRMAWSGSSISSLTPFLTQKLFSRSEKVGGGLLASSTSPQYF